MNQTYSAIRRIAPPILMVLQLLCGIMILLSGDAAIPWLAYGAVGLGLVVMAAAWSIKASKPRVDGILFLVSALAGGLLLGSWQAGFPATLPVWLWCIASVLLATVGIVLDADSKQSRSQNRF